jgi:hypothetical protein
VKAKTAKNLPPHSPALSAGTVSDSDLDSVSEEEDLIRGSVVSFNSSFITSTINKSGKNVGSNALVSYQNADVPSSQGSSATDLDVSGPVILSRPLESPAAASPCVKVWKKNGGVGRKCGRQVEPQHMPKTASETRGKATEAERGRREQEDEKDEGEDDE